MPFKSRWAKCCYNHDYYIKHIEELKEKRTGLIFCEACNKNISKINIMKHYKRRTHILQDEDLRQRKYMNRVLNQKFDSNISSIIASFYI